MRLEKTRIRGLLAFKEPYEIDWTEHGALVAVCGKNGSGKTTLLESVPACLYATMPSRPGSLYDYAHGRDAFIEQAFRDGPTLRVVLDAEARKVEGYVTIDGNAASSGKIREYKDLVEQHCGSWDLFMASVFASQNRTGDILAMPKGQRKALFAELLGLHRLEALAAMSQERRVFATSARDTQRGRLAAAEAVTAGREQASSDLLRAEATALEAAEALDAARKTEIAARDAYRHGEVAEARVASLREKRDAYAVELVTAREAEKARGRELEEAKDRLARSQREVAARRRRLVAVVDAEADAARGREEEESRLRADLGRLPEMRERAARAPDLAAAHDAWREAKVKAEVTATAVLAAEQQHRDATMAWDREVRRTAEENERRRARAELAHEVPCAEPEHTIIQSRCKLLDEAMLARRTSAEPDTGIKLRRSEASEAVRLALEAHEAALQAAGPEPDPAERQAAHLAATYVAACGAAQERLKALEEWPPDQGAERLAEADELASVGVAELSAGVDAHDGRWATSVQAVTVFQGKVDAADAALEAFEAPDMARLRARGADAIRGVQQVEAHAKEADAACIKIEAELDRIAKAETTASAVRAALELDDTEVAEWKLLERAFGRDGIQALEISAAGPAVAAITNELLLACYGPRFSLGIETLREKKSARGEYAETFDIRVWDGADERAVEALSGGERVIVGEALSLAIAIVVAQRGGAAWKTLWRDETAGALDAANAQRYVDMLRRALDLGGYEQLIFVSHQREVWERADSVVRVG